MLGFLRYLLVSVFILFLVSAVSIVWPKFTRSPRPDILNQVYEISSKTELGQRAVNILGVSDSSSKEPLNLQDLVKSAAQNAASTIESRAQYVILTQATRAIMSQIEKLNETDKKALQSIICQPESSASGSNQ